MNFIESFCRIKIFILDVLFPIECLGCGQENVWLCDECLDQIPINQVDKCVVCKFPSASGLTHPACRAETFLDGVIIACPWESQLLQDVIHKYKYNFIQNLSYPLAQLLFKKLRACQSDSLITDKESPQPEPSVLEDSLFRILRDQTDKKIIVVPVPLHKRRLRWRGFNQAQLLAERTADQLGLTADNNILVRKKYTIPQMSLKRQKRLDNLRHVFQLTAYGQNLIDQDRNIFLLVDDVLTTGTTMRECAQVLKDFGAARVWGLALARG